ncbi:MAG: PAAR-like domain-containing protein [Paracoccaceae bacterium]
MPVTVNVNDMSLSHKASMGIAMATVPDVCKTPAPPAPPVPIPYPNIAQSSTLSGGTTTVKADGGQMCANQPSKYDMSNGDEAGVLGGVVSGVNMKAAEWILFSFNVDLEGKGACRLSDKMTNNNKNTVCL